MANISRISAGDVKCVLQKADFTHEQLGKKIDLQVVVNGVGAALEQDGRKVAVQYEVVVVKTGVSEPLGKFGFVAIIPLTEKMDLHEFMKQESLQSAHEHASVAISHFLNSLLSLAGIAIADYMPALRTMKFSPGQQISSSPH